MVPTASGPGSGSILPAPTGAIRYIRVIRGYDLHEVV